MSRLQRGFVHVVLMGLLGLLCWPECARSDENDLLAYCLENSSHCALSVEAIDENWERHWNADRPQVLASTYKIVMLLGYAQAVADGAMSPDDTVDKNEWARYFSGGGSLSTSWDQMGTPDRPRLDELARVMILNSDNSAPDLFQTLLGKKRVKQAVRQFGWHDLPAPISAMFGLWQNLNGIGGSGNRVAADYGGFEADGYQKELSRHTKSLRKDSFLRTVRTSLCDQPPWFAGPPPCVPPQPGTTLGSFRTLENHHFNRSTTRSYAALMRRLLDRSLLADAAQEVVERHLEAWLEVFPSLSPAFSRYGLKGGNLATGEGNEILTWAHYMATGSGRYVVVVFLRDMGATGDSPEGADVNAFAQQFALSAGFRQTVRDAIGAASLPPELAPQLKKVKLQGGKNLTVKAKVFNVSPVSSGRPVEVSLFLLDDADVEGAEPVDTVRVKTLAGYKSKAITLKATDPEAAGKLAVVLIDSGEEVSEQDEANNLTWQRLD